MKIGIYEKAINNKFSIEEKIIIAKKAQYDFIELSIDESDEKLSRLNWDEKKLAEVKKILIKHNFYFNSMTLSGHRRFPFGSKNETVRLKAFEIMKNAIRISKFLGISNIQLAGYDVYYEKSDKKTKKLFLEGMKWASKLAQEHTILLSFEIMDTEFMGTVSKAMKYINKINSPFLHIYPDIGNLSQWTDNIEKELLLGRNHILGIHFKDTRPNVFKNVPFGKGTVDFINIMSILNNMEYKGPFLIEMWSKNECDESSKENIKYIQTARKFFLEKAKYGGYKNV